MKYKQKSLNVNMLLNFLKTIFTTVFPLITFKYVTSVLGKEGIGAINFSNSIIQYFSIFAALGISTYAIRECAKVRINNEKISLLSSELFSINIISTLISYSILFFIVLFVPALSTNRILILILSVSIICTTLGTEWVNIVYEDFLYITIRTIFFQIFTFVLVIFFVKNQTDIFKYALISSFSSFVINFLNYIYVKKYVNLKLLFNNKLLRHLKPIFTIFAMNIAIFIYVTSDITILGFLRGETEVGLYTVSSKIYSCIKTILASVISVTIPRFAYIIDSNKEEYLVQLKSIFSIILLFGIPIVVGIILLPDFFITLISNKDYLESKITLCTLSVAILPTLLSTIINNNILLPQRKESKILFSTLIGGFINIVLNLILIPRYGFNAAAFTTLIAEWCVFFIAVFQSRTMLINLPRYKLVIDLLKTLFGVIGIVLLYFLYFTLIKKKFVTITIYILLCIIVYFMIEVLLKHSELMSLIKKRKS